MVCCCSGCSWWALSFTTRVDGVVVDARSLPMNRIRPQSLQLPASDPVFRPLDVDPSPASFVDARHGFMLTFTQQPGLADLRLATDAITAFYRSGNQWRRQEGKGGCTKMSRKKIWWQLGFPIFPFAIIV